MNILHIIQDMNIGGAQRVLYNIAKRMKNDHHIVLTYQVCDEYKELLRQLLNTEVKVIMNMGEFVRAIQDYTYDIVHYHWWPGMKVMGTIFEKKKILNYSPKIKKNLLPNRLYSEESVPLSQLKYHII